MRDMNENELEPELLAAGRSVARLRRAKAPAGLLDRTLERLAKFPAERPKMWILRPITHPMARFAAAAMLMAMVHSFTYPDVASAVGSRIEHNIVGSKMVDRVEQIVDEIVPSNAEGYSQYELDMYTGTYNVNTTSANARRRPTTAKARPNSRV